MALSQHLVSQVAWLPKTESLITALDSLEIVILANGECTVIRNQWLGDFWNCRANQFIVTPHYVFTAFSSNTILLYKWRKRQACFRPFIKSLEDVAALNDETAYVIHEGSRQLTLFSLKILKPLKSLDICLPSVRGKKERLTIFAFMTVKCLHRSCWIAIITQDVNTVFRLSLVHKSLNFTGDTVKLKKLRHFGEPTHLNCISIGSEDYILVAYEKYLVLQVYRVVKPSNLEVQLAFEGTIIQKEDHEHLPIVSSLFFHQGHIMVARSDGIVTRIRLEGLESGSSPIKELTMMEE